MSSNDPTLTLILAEISAALFIAILVILTGMLLRKRKQSSMLRAMLKRITDNEEERKQALRTVYKPIPGIDDKLLDSIIHDIITQENDFAAQLGRAFIGGNMDFLSRLDEKVIVFTSPYERLAAQREDVPETNEKDSPLEFDDAIDDLISDGDQDKTTLHNPDFDLSADDEPSESENETHPDGLGIAEIPEELLSGISDSSDGRNGPNDK